METLLGELDEKPSSDMLPRGSSEKRLRYGPSDSLIASFFGLPRSDPAFGHGRNWVTTLWRESRQVMQAIRSSLMLQSSYAKLLSELPQSTIDFCAADDLGTDEGRSNAWLHLLTLHRGEVVELAPGHNERFLAEGARPTPDKVLHHWSEQFLCLQPKPVDSHGRKRSRQPLVAVAQPVGADPTNVFLRWEFGQLPSWDADIEYKAANAARALALTRAGDLHPDWKLQTLRSVVPCRAARRFHWRRVCGCITLGRLFGMLGKDFSADVLYHFYRTRRVVVAKVRKGK